MIKADSIELYKSLAKVVSKGLYDAESDDLKSDEATWKAELATYNKIIQGLDITTSNISNIIKKLFQKLPDNLS